MGTARKGFGEVNELRQLADFFRKQFAAAAVGCGDQMPALESLKVSSKRARQNWPSGDHQIFAGKDSQSRRPCFSDCRAR
jgi:hypothetical protein